MCREVSSLRPRVPVFAFVAAGVRVVGGASTDSVTAVVAIGVVVGLVVGKAVGIFGGTWLFARFTRAQLDDDLARKDVAGLSLLAGVGFTVSLLFGELAFGSGSPKDDHARLAVLVGSVVAALLAPSSCGDTTATTSWSTRGRTRTSTVTGSPTSTSGPHPGPDLVRLIGSTPPSRQVGSSGRTDVRRHGSRP